LNCDRKAFQELAWRIHACPFHHVSLEERRRLMRLCEVKLGVGAIARELGRHRSTISCELRRSWWHDAEVP
jgi:transposase, IS30 family